MRARHPLGLATRLFGLGVCGLGVAGCGEESLSPVEPPGYVTPPERCEPVDPSEPTRFSACNSGSGVFGEWQLDHAGLPSYFYGLDERTDARASYLLSDGTTSDRHWHALGNRRLNVLFGNDGAVEVVTQDRGVSYLNVFDPEQESYAGGFSYLDDGEVTWSTAHRYLPRGAEQERRFGMGYAETITRHRGLTVTRRLGAPPGDASLVLSEVTLENTAQVSREVAHYEVWDVGRRAIEINWIVSGKAIPGAPATARRLRDALNARFEEEVSYDPEMQLLGVRRRYVGSEPRLPRETPSARDDYPVDPFLVAYDGPVDDLYVDQASFFAGHPEAPEAVVTGVAGEGTAGGSLRSVGGEGQPLVLVMKSRITLGAGERRHLRFGYGYARNEAPFSPVVEAGRLVEDVREAQANDLKPKLFYFAAPRDPALHREMAWHSYQVETSIGHRDYWDTPVVPQGSAYLYLHGADGAARDLGLFAVPLVYTDAALARAELLLYMGIQHAEGEAFAYAFQGHGMTDTAGIHTAPSDLPIFFLWALGEYLAVTGDLDFLEADAPFYPREARPDAVVWDHLVAAARHLFDVVGTGEHGLIRVQTGDWSDGIVVAAPDRELAVAKGESVPNTQMAATILPRVADLIQERAPSLAAEIRTRVAGYRQALQGEWTGQFYTRAYYGDGMPVDADEVNPEAQIWALVGDLFDPPERRGELVELLTEERDTALGLALWKDGQVWPAISVPYTWGLARSHPALAWDHLSRNTLRAHATTHPEVWTGIWSGPDGVSSRSGLAWASEVTPMTDFPVQNNNLHALPILAALRVAGIDADAEGMIVAPPSLEPVALRSERIDLAVSETRIEGRYRPLGSRKLTLLAPPNTRFAKVEREDGSSVDHDGLVATLSALGDVSFVATLEARDP
ncbi:MAG: hypothetical protein R3B72_28830 [Polyangiaceae bacterium]